MASRRTAWIRGGWERVPFAGALVSILLAAGTLGAAAPRNVIIFIGDGMGFEQVKAGGLFANGSAGSLSFEVFPYLGQVTTHSGNSAVTDSAAAATAIATGVKVSNGVISMAYPGDGSELLTLLEHFEAREKSAGLVTTTYVTHATPAAFGAHEPSRDLTSAIASDYLDQTHPEVLFGGGGNGLTPLLAEAAGYRVVADRQGLLALDTESSGPVSGQFGSTYMPYEHDGMGNLPHLSEMTAAALRILDNDREGFFLMVEGGMIDLACHGNDLPRAVGEVVEFDRAVRAALEWAAGRTDTLIIVTADHETGGMRVVAGGGAGFYPTVTWSTTGHTAADVPVYGWGPNAEWINGAMDNTEFFGLAAAEPIGPATSPDPPDGAIDVPSGIVLGWTAGEGAVSHMVRFGATDTPPLAAVVTETSFDPGQLAAGVRYFWRVDEVSPAGTVEGPLWTFIVASGCIPSEMTIDSIILGKVKAFRGAKAGTATVTVLDDCGGAVEGAVVTGHFTGSFAAESPMTGTTDTAGRVIFTTSTSQKRPSFSFAVDSVARESLLWRR